MSGADYVVPAYAGSFDNVWQQANGEEASETLQLGNMKSIAGKLLHTKADMGLKLTILQMPLNSSQKHSRCSLSKELILRSVLPHIR